MLLDEIFKGMNFQSDAAAPETNNIRQLDNVDLSAFVQVEVERGSEFSAPYSQLGFKMSLTDYDVNSVSFKIDFENPLSVSQGRQSDIVHVYFPEPDMFIAKKTGLALSLGEEEEDDQIEMDLPRQFPDSNLFKDMGDAGNSVKLVSQAAMGANVALTVFLSVSLKAMWNMVHVLQVIIFLPELLDFPPNTQLFINSLNEAIELEQFKEFVYELVLPTEVNELIHKDAEELEGEAAASGSNIFITMGIFAIALVGLVILLILYCILKTFAARLKRCCGGIIAKMKKALFFDGIIRYLIEGNLKITFANLAVLGSMYVGFDASSATDDEEVSLYVSLGFIGLVVFWIIFSMIYPLVCRHKLQDKDVIERFGAMYEGIKTDRALPAVYTSVFCLRRFMMVMALVFLKDSPFTMIYLYLAIYTANFTYMVHAAANEERIMNWLEYMSELSLIGLLYMMLFFIRMNQLDALIVWDAGVGAIAILGTCFFVNILYLVTTSCIKMRQKAKLILIRRANLRAHRLRKFKKRIKDNIQPVQKVEKPVEDVALNNWDITKYYSDYKVDLNTV